MMKIEDNVNQISARWVVSLPLVLICTPFLVLPLGFQGASPDQPQLFWKWTLASIVGLLPSAVIYFLAGKLYFSKHKSEMVPIWTVLTFGLILGAFKGFVTGIASWRLNLLDAFPWDEILYRTVNAGCIGMIFIPSTSILANSYTTFTQNRRKLLEQYLNHENSRIEHETVSAALKEKLSLKIDDHLLKILNEAKLKLSSTSEPESEWEKIAAILRNTALTAVRPLSHELWTSQNKRIVMGISEYFRYSLRIIKFETPWIIALYTLTTYQYLDLRTPWNVALISIFLRDVLLFIIFTCAQIFRSIGNQTNKGHFFVILLSALVIHYPGLWLVNNVTGLENTIFNISESIWIAVLVILVGIFRAFTTTQLYELRQLENLIEHAKLAEMASRNELERFSREIAKYLHGTMQSRLMASAMAIENAAKFGDKKTLDKEVKGALASLTMPSKDYLLGRTKSIRNSFREIISKWDGIVEVSSSISNELVKMDSQTELDIADIVNEALSNAFRHGQATSATVSVYINTNNKIEVEVLDNGVGPMNGEYGIGCLLFSSLSENWSLDKRDNDKGSALVVELSQRQI